MESTYFMASLTIDDILEAMWASVADRFKISDRRHLIAKWRKLFRKTGLTPKRYLCVLHYGNGHYMVESESRPGQLHAVDIEERACSCEFYLYNNGKKCKHLEHIEKLDAQGLLPTNTKWKMKDQCSPNTASAE